jgi:glycerol-3-phosphate acyltransferase PlsX
MRIVVDVMGGDHGSGVAIDGVKLALQAYPHISELHLVGQQAEIEAALLRVRLSDSRLRIHHASEVISMQDKPLDAVRKKKDCSMVRAMELVRDGKAEAVISAGNTGALVASATFKIRRLEPVDRPAIATVVPSSQGEFVLLDAGANHECKPAHLVQFAIMGSAYSRGVLGREKPRVGILCNGSEETKGNELTQESARLCRQTDLNFIGYIEGNDMFADRVDVVVTDGFVGNIVLKSVEGMGKAIVGLLRRELTANPLRKAGALLAQGALKSIKRRMDPEGYGGAPLLGLNGVVIKTHGSARERAFMNAIRVATETIQHKINDTIVREVTQANEKLGLNKATAQTPAPAVA